MKTQLINFIIPDELLKKVDLLARKESRSRSEVLREAARRIIQESEQEKQDFRVIAKSAKRINLSENEAVALIDEIRSKLQEIENIPFRLKNLD